MPSFFVRVQLFQRAQEHPDYERLHDAMEGRGYLMHLEHRGRDSVYELPHAMYEIRRDVDAATVLKEVRRIADGVWKNNAILVVEAADYAWHGLKKATLLQQLTHRLAQIMRWN